MIDKDKILDIMFNGDYINKLTDEDIYKLVDKIVDTIEAENGKKTKMDIINTMVKELYEDKKKKEEDGLYKIYKYCITIGTMGEDYKTTLYVSFSKDFDEFENFIYDKLCNEKFIGFRIYNDKGEKYSRFFKCDEIEEISVERAE